MNEAFELSVHGHLFRIQPPEVEPGRALILAVHGLTGDEHSMEIFTRKLQRAFWVIYPRAPHATASGGLSCVKTALGIHQSASDFFQVAQDLYRDLDLLAIDLETTHLPLFTMGFSQGAALALVFSSLFSQPHSHHALLAGYLPSGLAVCSDSMHLRHYFVAHGSRDTTVPVVQAHQVVKFLQDSGAETIYCRSNTAHKLSLECVRQLESFFLGEIPSLTAPA
jgi:predicted esterase